MGLTRIETQENLGLNHPIREEEVELIDYLRVIWRRKKLILFFTLLCIMISGTISFLMPPVYEVTAQLRIGRVWDKEVENPYLSSELVNSDDFLTRIIEQLGLKTTSYKMRRDKTIHVGVLEGGAMGQKTPLALSITTRARDPQQAVDIGKMVSMFLIDGHQIRFQEKLREYQAYEKELARDMARMEGQISDLDQMIKKQAHSTSLNVPSVVLLQAQLEQKGIQLLTLKKELRDTRINNASSTVTESTKLIAPPVLPREPLNSRPLLTMAVGGLIGLFLILIIIFFLEYLAQVRIRENEKI